MVDDGSTDRTPRIVADLAISDCRLRVLTLPARGLVAALEAGRASAQAAYIARMDGDDIAYPGRLAAQMEYLDQHADVVAVGGQVDLIDAQGRVLKRGAYPTTPDDCRAYLQYGSPFCHPAVMMRAEALARCGGYRRRFEPAEDFDLWLRLSSIGELANLETTVLRYRRHGATVTSNRAAANAVAVACALVEATFHVSLDCAGEQQPVQSRDWRELEPQLPAAARLFGRAAYLRALVLNGGIVDETETSFLIASVPALRDDSSPLVSRDGLAFMLVRAAYQLARHGKVAPAARLLGAASRHVPLETAREAIRTVARRVFNAPAVPRGRRVTCASAR